MISAGIGLVSIVVAGAFLSALGQQDCLRPSRVHNRVGISDVSIGSVFLFPRSVVSRPSSGVMTSSFGESLRCPFSPIYREGY